MAKDLAYYKSLPVAYSDQEMYDWPDRSQTVRFGGTSQLWTWMGGDSGQFEYRGQNVPSDIYAIMIGDAKDPGDGDSDGGSDPGGGARPPSFPSTGPVFTPLDLNAPNENPYYKYNYPGYAPSTGANFQSQGLLTENIGYGAADPYQPWSQQYGNEYFSGYGGDNLWNYNPPSLPGSKVGFS
tara:strand:- start:58 stop:603 length:546 start_codon:yes stop_codon:yes gene_type:complete